MHSFWKLQTIWTMWHILINLYFNKFFTWTILSTDVIWVKKSLQENLALNFFNYEHGWSKKFWAKI